MLNARKLKSRMIEAGVTQRELAVKLGISENTLSKCFTGKRCFDTEEVLAICNLLGIQENSQKADIFLS